MSPLVAGEKLKVTPGLPGSGVHTLVMGSTSRDLGRKVPVRKQCRVPGRAGSVRNSVTFVGPGSRRKRGESVEGRAEGRAIAAGMKGMRENASASRQEVAVGCQSHDMDIGYAYTRLA